MHVRALRGVGVVLGRFFHDLHFKTHRQVLRRIAGGIITGLIAQDAVHHVFPGHDRVQRMHSHGDGEVSAINIQRFVGRERETPIFARGILSLSQDNVRGNVDPPGGRDEELMWEPGGTRKFKFTMVCAARGAVVSGTAAKARVGALPAVCAPPGSALNEAMSRSNPNVVRCFVRRRFVL